MIAVISTVAVVLGTMVGCAAKDNGSQTTQTATLAQTTQGGGQTTQSETQIQPTEIVFWHGMAGKQEETLTAITDKFNAENTYGIKVTLVNQGAYKDLSSKLTASAAADALPDLSQAYNNWLSSYTDKIVHLDDFVASDFDNYDDIIQGYRDENSQFGFISGVPFNKSTYVLFYNKTLFDELGIAPPATWTEFTEVAKKIKEKKGFEAIGFDDLAGMLQTMLAQNGVGYFDENQALFDNEAGLETVTYIMDLYNNGYARLVGEDGYFSNVISNQLIASYVGSSTGASYIKAEGWELGAAPAPVSKEKSAMAAGTNVVMFSKDANHQKAAWEYLKFLTSAESTTEWAIQTGYLPVRTSAYESEAYKAFMEKDATAPAAHSQSGYFISQPAVDGSYDIMSAVSAKLEELILNKADGKTAHKELVDAVNAILKK